MFAYCGNNPVARADAGGKLWGQVALGVLVQYGSDVLGNYFSGKTGVDLFIPTSSITDYAAAAVTAIIPGSGLGGALARSVIAEGMTWVGNILEGNASENNFKSSAVNIAISTGADWFLGGILDHFDDVVRQSDLATYAKNTAMQTSTSLPRVHAKMRYAAKMAQVANDLVSTFANICSSYIISTIS